MKKITISKKFLVKEYIRNKKSSYKIAELLDCSDVTIGRKLKENNIPIRTIIEIMKNRNYKGSNNPNWKGKRYYCKDCGKETTRPSSKRCKKCCYIFITKTRKQSGKNNPMYGKHWTKKSKKKLLLTFKKRKINIGRKNGMYSKPSPHGKRIYYKGILMRSSWEITFAQWLDLSDIRWFYESKRFDLGSITYVPDFYLPLFDCYIEIKGRWRNNDKKKFKLFKKLYPKIEIKVLMYEELKILGVL